MQDFEIVFIKIVDELINSLDYAINNEKNTENSQKNGEDKLLLDNKMINSDDLEDFSEEFAIDEKEKAKFCENLI